MISDLIPRLHLNIVLGFCIAERLQDGLGRTVLLAGRAPPVTLWCFKGTETANVVLLNFASRVATLYH
jgi:hypothetical protein